MESVCNSLESLLNNAPDYAALSNWHIGELDDEPGYWKAAKEAETQWDNSVESVLDYAGRQAELQLWRSVSLTEDSGINLKILLLKSIIAQICADDLPNPHENMPVSLLKDYEEARRVFPDSARGAAALLRLALEKLCIELEC